MDSKSPISKTFVAEESEALTYVLSAGSTVTSLSPFRLKDMLKHEVSEKNSGDNTSKMIVILLRIIIK